MLQNSLECWHSKRIHSVTPLFGISLFEGCTSQWSWSYCWLLAMLVELQIWHLLTSVSNSSQEPYPLLISFWKPHKPDTSASISRWINELLTKAGSINTEIFKGHSSWSRAAASSAARMQGVRWTFWTWLDGHENQPLKDSIISLWNSDLTDPCEIYNFMSLVGVLCNTMQYHMVGYPTWNVKVYALIPKQYLS